MNHNLVFDLAHRTQSAHMILRNQNQFLEVLEIDNDGCKSRRFVSDSEKQTVFDGSFFDHDATTFGLGVSRGEIFALIGDRLVRCGPGFVTEIRRKGEARAFVAIDDSKVLVIIDYAPSSVGWNPFFGIDDEDTDAFLWIHNVLSSAERRAVFVAHNGGDD